MSASDEHWATSTSPEEVPRPADGEKVTTDTGFDTQPTPTTVSDTAGNHVDRDAPTAVVDEDFGVPFLYSNMIDATTDTEWSEIFAAECQLAGFSTRPVAEQASHSRPVFEPVDMEKMVEEVLKNEAQEESNCPAFIPGAIAKSICPRDLVLSQGFEAADLGDTLHTGNPPVAFDVEDLSTYIIPPEDPEVSMDLERFVAGERILFRDGYFPVPESQRAKFLEDPCAEDLDQFEQCERCKSWLNSCVSRLQVLCDPENSHVSYPEMRNEWQLSLMSKTHHDEEATKCIAHTCGKEVEGRDGTDSLDPVYQLAAGCDTVVTTHPIFNTYRSVENGETISINFEKAQKYGFKGTLYPNPIHIVALGLGIRDAWLAPATTCDSRITKIFVLKGCKELDKANPPDIMKYIFKGHNDPTNGFMDRIGMRAGIGVEYDPLPEWDDILQDIPTSPSESQICEQDREKLTANTPGNAMDLDRPLPIRSKQPTSDSSQRNEKQLTANTPGNAMDLDKPIPVRSKEPTTQASQQNELLTKPITAAANMMTDSAPDDVPSPQGGKTSFHRTFRLDDGTLITQYGLMGVNNPPSAPHREPSSANTRTITEYALRGVNNPPSTPHRQPSSANTRTITQYAVRGIDNPPSTPHREPSQHSGLQREDESTVMRLCNAMGLNDPALPPQLRSTLRRAMTGLVGEQEKPDETSSDEL
ncbi:hypothetical protein GGR57DRAFT_512240 [Xylariaceae sp. FL1272]|nr:hypothetical protein GGR57DRAFT_512240 [Xylariaceae sp. FL1272]